MFGLLLTVIRIMNVTEVKCEYWFHHFVKQLFNKKKMLNSEYYTSVLMYRAANEPEHCAYYAIIFVIL